MLPLSNEMWNNQDCPENPIICYPQSVQRYTLNRLSRWAGVSAHMQLDMFSRSDSNYELNDLIHFVDLLPF